jgi:hypothetical protein
VGKARAARAGSGVHDRAARPGVTSTVGAARRAASARREIFAIGARRGPRLGRTETGDVGRGVHGRNIGELGHNNVIVGTLLFNGRQDAFHTTELKSPDDLVTAWENVLHEINIIPRNRREARHVEDVDKAPNGAGVNAEVQRSVSNGIGLLTPADIIGIANTHVTLTKKGAEVSEVTLVARDGIIRARGRR